MDSDSDRRRELDLLLDSLWREHGAFVFLVAQRLVHDVEAARDATQIAFVRAFRWIASHPPMESPNYRAWLAQIVTNCVRDAKRRKTLPKEKQGGGPDGDAPSPLDGVADAGAPDPAAVLASSEVADIVRRCVAALNAKLRRAVELCHFAGESAASAAAALTLEEQLSTALDENAVRQRLHRARAKLRACVAERAPSVALEGA